MAVINITKENFAQEVLHSEKPVLLDFWASWCGPCRMLSPVVDEVAEERTDVKVGKVNVDEQPDLAAQFGVMSIPTLPPQGRCAGAAGLNYCFEKGYSGAPAGVLLYPFLRKWRYQFKKIIHASTNGTTKPKQKKNKRSSTTFIHLAERVPKDMA